jgi:hypothetical protein
VIGKIRFPWFDGEPPVEAVLEDNREWRCELREVQDYLNTTHTVSLYSSADGQPGVRQLHAAARALNGKVVSVKPVETRKGVIY